MQRIVILIFVISFGMAMGGKEDSLPLSQNGQSKDPLVDSEAKAVVLIFLASDCPISNRYAPLVNRLHNAYQRQGIRFYAVYPMAQDSWKVIRSHQKDYGYNLEPLKDPNHYLVKLAEANVTPEVSVFLPGSSKERQWIYRGRIDDLYVDFGKWRRTPTKNDLKETLDSIIAGVHLEPRRTRAVGCYINN